MIVQARLDEWEGVIGHGRTVMGRSERKSLERIVFVTGPPGHRNQRAPGPIPRPAPVHGLGRGCFFLPSAPAPVRAPAPFKAPDSPP